MIDRFEIKNFKMFDELTINHLAPITLIGGKNNVGKSGLLEGIVVASARENPNLFENLLGKRNIHRVENSAECVWLPYFHNFDERNAIEFRVFFNSAVQPEVTRISYGKTARTRLVTRHRVIKVSSGCSSSAELSPHVAKVDEKNLIEELVRFIKIVAPEVRDISAAPECVLLDCGFKKKINVSLSGEGTMRFLYIASIVLAVEPEILLIDAIENGIHYSVLPKFWEALSTLCREKNVQLIAATHSKECIEAAAQVMADKPEEDFAFIRLQRDNNEKIVAVEMTAEDVCDMSQLDWEIR